MFVRAIPPRDAALFAADLLMIALDVHYRRTNSAGWRALAELASEAEDAHTKTLRRLVGAEAARRARSWATRPVEARRMALAAWYRALALVMFGAARWRP